MARNKTEDEKSKKLTPIASKSWLTGVIGKVEALDSIQKQAASTEEEINEQFRGVEVSELFNIPKGLKGREGGTPIIVNIDGKSYIALCDLSYMPGTGLGMGEEPPKGWFVEAILPPPPVVTL